MDQLNKVQVILFKLKGGKPIFLLLKRVGSKKTWWQGISGGVESYDKNLIEACAREISEELGLNIDYDKITEELGSFSFITNRAGYEGQTAKEYIFGAELPQNFIPKLSNEHSEFKWLSASEAKELIDFRESKEAVDKITSMFAA